MPSQFRNAVLAQLDSDQVSRLQLAPIELEAGRELMIPEEDHSNALLFLESGVASSTISFADGRAIETNLLGREAVIGALRVLPPDSPPHWVKMELAGSGFTASMRAVEQEMARTGSLFGLLVLSMGIRLREVMQIAACNGTHNQQQRFARWLLQCSDRAASRKLPVSQGRIAELLGCRAASISQASSTMQELKLIRQHRGYIEILDPMRLEELSCECIHAIRGTLRCADVKLLARL